MAKTVPQEQQGQLVPKEPQVLLVLQVLPEPKV